jgi:putative phosphoribosyl transferase
VADRRLPDYPDLEQYRRQAKDLRKALAAGDAAALERLRQFHPQAALSRPAKLADAQLVIAREHGLPSWPAFVAEVDARQGIAFPALEIDGAEGARAAVLFVLAGNVGSRHLGMRQIADRLRGAGFASVLADLLTAEEAMQDAIDEALCFDVSLLSERAGQALERIGLEPRLSSLPLALLCGGTGGAAGVQLARRHPEAVRALVSVAGRPDLAGAALAHVRAPSLFIVGGEDPVAHGFTRTMLEIFPRDVAHRLEVVRGIGPRFEEGPAAARAAELAIAWLDAHLQPAEQVA